VYKNQNICNRKSDVERMIYELQAPVASIYEDLFIFIDPAAGGPSSDYGIMTVTRNRGILVVGTLCCLNTFFNSFRRTLWLQKISIKILTRALAPKESAYKILLLDHVYKIAGLQPFIL
jgi:hypothetical protein